MLRPCQHRVVPGFLVVVSGLPAAGKSTLARRLARDLLMPVVSRDRLRDAVYTDFQSAVAARGPELGPTMDRLVTTVLTSILEVGGAAIIDGNFNIQPQADAIRALIAELAPGSIEVCLWGDPDVLRRRFADRADPPLTADLEPYFDEVVHRARWTVLAPPSPTVHLDTTDLAAVDAAYNSLVALVEDARDGAALRDRDRTGHASG